MKVYLASAGVPPEWSAIPEYSQQLAEQRGPQRHHEVHDPAEADVVLFTDCHVIPSSDWALKAITSSEVARRFPHKVAIHNERARPWCRLPGVYVSMPASGFVARWQVAGTYFALDPLAASERLVGAAAEPDILVSFVGGATHPCRDAIFRIRDPRSYVQRVDGFLLHDVQSERYDELRQHFADVVHRSKFVLCPRGHGTSSFRLYETMSAGRVPVIIADDWVPPIGPRWDEISIRWPEAHIDDLPRHLAGRELEAAAMGARARDAYERWFARDVVLAHQLDHLEALTDSKGFSEFPRGGCRNRQYFRTLRGATRAQVRHLRRSLSVSTPGA
jgi:hypothetical protein